MLTLFLLLLLIYILIYSWQTKSVSLIVLLLVFVSVIAAVLIGKVPDSISPLDFINVLFTVLILFILIIPFKHYTKFTKVNIANVNKIKRLSNIVFYICFLSLVVNSVCCVVIWTVVDDFNSFKQGGELTTEFMYEELPIPHVFISLASIGSAFSYFAIGFHFYYLIHGKYFKAILFLLVSLSLPIGGLMMFSRSALVQYILLYSVYLHLSYHSFDLKIKKRVKIIVSFFIFLLLTVMTMITLNRFGDKSLLEIPNSSLIKDDVLFSLFDYLSQWYENGITIMREYSFPPLGGKLSNMFYYFIESKGTGYSTVALREEIWPNHWYTFNGLFSILLFDFGYVGTVFLCFIYYRIIKSLAPYNNSIDSFTLLSFGVLITLPLMSVFGNYLESISYHFAIVLCFIFKLYLQYKFKKIC